MDIFNKKFVKKESNDNKQNNRKNIDISTESQESYSLRTNKSNNNKEELKGNLKTLKKQTNVDLPENNATSQFDPYDYVRNSAEFSDIITNLVLAVIFFFPLGILSIILYNKSNNNNYDTAARLRFLKQSKSVAETSTGLGFVIIVIYYVFFY